MIDGIVGEIASMVLPAGSAAAIIIQSVGSRKKVMSRIDKVEQQIQLLTMHDENLSLAERTDAGKRFIDLGGNGSGAAYFEKLKELYQSKIKSLLPKEKT